MRLFRLLVGEIILITTFISCSKSSDPAPTPAITDSVADITSYSIVNMNPAVTISPYAIQIRFADNMLSAEDLVATFKLTPGAEAKVNGIKQVSDASKNTYNLPFTYAVTNKQGFSKRWTVTSTNNDYSLNYGLGSFVKKSLSNDHSYSWYYNQIGTGEFAQINCGPSCASMAMKWYDSSYDKPVKYARDFYPINKNEWGMGTVATFLDSHGCPYKSFDLTDSPETTRDLFKNLLDEGRICLVIINTGTIRPFQGVASDLHADNYYPTSGSNHVIVLYGYKEVDNETFFQVKDPWGSSTNNDGSFCGDGRYYRYSDIWSGAHAIDNNTLTIPKK